MLSRAIFVSWIFFDVSSFLIWELISEVTSVSNQILKVGDILRRGIYEKKLFPRQIRMKYTPAKDLRPKEHNFGVLKYFKISRF